MADVQGASNEVYTIARYLFAWDPAHAESTTAYDLAAEADPERLERLGDLRRKYQKHGEWYIHVRENGDARALRELPDDVPASDVVDITLDVGSATPLQDRLRAIAHSLRSSPIDPNALLMAGLTDDILAACRPDNSERLFAEIRRDAWSEVLGMMGAGADATLILQHAHGFLNEVQQRVPGLRNGPGGDGKLIASLLALQALILAAAKHAWSPGDEAVSLIESISYIAAPSPVPLHVVVQGLCERMIRKSRIDVVSGVADTLKAQGDAHIAQALDADARGFYPPLYASMAYELAVVLIGKAAARSSKIRTTRSAGRSSPTTPRSARCGPSLRWASRSET